MYPRSEPYDSGELVMSDGQLVYWEQSGTPDGIPALYLHGGPGGGLGQRGYITKFDPDRYRVIALAQRGCGRSVPLACDDAHDLDANTTPRLTQDLEELRKHLNVSAWVINGVSWGSTLTLAYAQEHPDRVLGVVLMAVTTTSRAEAEWITATVGAIYPEEWDCFASHAERADPTYVRCRPPPGICTGAGQRARSSSMRARATVALTWPTVGGTPTTTSRLSVCRVSALGAAENVTRCRVWGGTSRWMFRSSISSDRGNSGSSLRNAMVICPDDALTTWRRVCMSRYARLE